MPWRTLRTPLVPLVLAFPLAMCGGARSSSSQASADGGKQAGLDETCTTVDDCVPPPSRCIEHSQLEYYEPLDCVRGKCQFSASRLVCTCYGGGCSYNSTTGGAGATGPLEPCTTPEDCTPPEPACLSPMSLVYYEPSCLPGSGCYYTTVEVACPCESGACTDAEASDAGEDADWADADGDH